MRSSTISELAEAVRENPDNSEAWEGLREAVGSRFPVYGWMWKLKSRMRGWPSYVGLVVAFLIFWGLPKLAKTFPPSEIIFFIVWAILLFAGLCLALALPIFDLLALMSIRDARVAVPRSTRGFVLLAQLHALATAVGIFLCLQKGLGATAFFGLLNLAAFLFTPLIMHGSYWGDKLFAAVSLVTIAFILVSCIVIFVPFS